MRKKNRNIIIAAAVVVVLVFIMFYANSKSALVRQLNGPIEGAENVLTIGDKLFVISKDNHIFTWQWRDLKKWPIVAKPNAAFVTAVNDDKIIYNLLKAEKLVLTDLKAEKELANLSLPYGSECEMIKTASNGEFVIISMSEKDWVKLALVDSDLKGLSPLFQKNRNDEKFTLYDFDITVDANLLAASGKKEKKAWVFVKDIKNDKILWEKTFDSSELANVIFSIDGKTVYASNTDRFIYVFETATGNPIRTLEMKKYPTSSTQLQTISCVAVSPDGKIYAAASQPSAQVYFWDTQTGKEICVINAAREIPSGVAFSPDSSLIAVSDLVRSTINIFKVPKN